MPNRSRSWAAGQICLLVADARVRERLTPELERVGFTVKSAPGESGALAILDRDPLCVVLLSHAVGLPTLSSLVLRAGRRHPEIPVVVFGSTATVDEAVDVMRRGATDYVPAPLDPAVLLLRVQRLLGQRAGAAAPSDEAPLAAEFPGLVGRSGPMMKVFSAIEKVSRYKANVLLLGESGTGKELVARALHAKGPRRQRLFVPINCATLGRELLENELFGHERGAFTGANERKKGLLELADNGTIFFDEIAEMDPSTQAKLLRVLERNEFRRVGGTEKVKIDLSVIAATNRNLPELIAGGKFREDLYYRLKVVMLVLPPLRDRKEDIPALIDTFIGDFNRRNSGKIKGVSPQVLKRFMEHDWPGNVRELKHAVESAAMLAPDQTIDLNGFETSLALGPTETKSAAATSSADEIRVPTDCPLSEVERRVILAHVQRAETKDGAARSLGIGLRTLYTKLRAYEQA
jgi:DNA-binding NtrC family response regulator